MQEDTDLVTDTEFDSTIKLAPFDGNADKSIHKVYSKMKETTPTVLMEKFTELALKDKFIIDQSKISSQSIASGMGNISETVYDYQIKKSLIYNPDMYHIHGKEIKNKLTKYFKTKDALEKQEIKDYLLNVCFFNKEYVEKLLKKEAPLSFPDSIFYDTSGDKPIIKAGEMKTSGQNDSTSVPGNIRKLTFGEKGSAIEPWRHKEGIVFERAILIFSTRLSKSQIFENKNTWINAVEGFPVSDNMASVQVFCNEEIVEWHTGIKIDPAVYEKYFIIMTASVQLMRVKDIQKP